MAKPITRAKYYGVKPASLVARSKTQIARAKAAVGAVSILWDEVCSGVSFDAEDIIRQLERLAEQSLPEAVEYLKEPMEGVDG